jgi:hypothetical protein
MRSQLSQVPQPVSGAKTATGQAYYSDSRMLWLELHPGPVSMLALTQIAGKVP